MLWSSVCDGLTSRSDSPPALVTSSWPIATSDEALPHFYSSFPASQQVGTARYNTMKSVYRGSDEDRKRAVSLNRITELKPDTKEMLTPSPSLLNFDEDNPKQTKELKVAASPRYIETYKASLKMKGLQINEIFSKNRNNVQKAKQRRKARRSKRNSEGSLSERSDYLKLPDINFGNGQSKHQDDKQDKSSTDSDYESLYKSSKSDKSLDDTLDSELGSHFDDIIKDYVETPGRQSKKKKTGRKLGNIVSSQRLNQLLDSTEPLKMENFYNYYP